MVRFVYLYNNNINRYCRHANSIGDAPTSPVDIWRYVKALIIIIYHYHLPLLLRAIRIAFLRNNKFSVVLKICAQSKLPGVLVYKLGRAQRCEFSFNQGISLSKCSSIANLNIYTLFLDIGALKVAILMLKDEIRAFGLSKFLKRIKIENKILKET